MRCFRYLILELTCELQVPVATQPSTWRSAKLPTRSREAPRLRSARRCRSLKTDVIGSMRCCCPSLSRTFEHKEMGNPLWRGDARDPTTSATSRRSILAIRAAKVRQLEMNYGAEADLKIILRAGIERAADVIGFGA